MGVVGALLVGAYVEWAGHLNNLTEVNEDRPPLLLYDKLLVALVSEQVFESPQGTVHVLASRQVKGLPCFVFHCFTTAAIGTPMLVYVHSSTIHVVIVRRPIGHR